MISNAKPKRPDFAHNLDRQVEVERDARLAALETFLNEQQAETARQGRVLNVKLKVGERLLQTVNGAVEKRG